VQARQHQGRDAQQVHLGGREAQERAVRERGREEEERDPQMDRPPVSPAAGPQQPSPRRVGEQGEEEQELREDRCDRLVGGRRAPPGEAEKGHEELQADQREEQAFPDLASQAAADLLA
jgi:hypothetical protein